MMEFTAAERRAGESILIQNRLITILQYAAGGTAAWFGYQGDWAAAFVAAIAIAIFKGGRPAVPPDLIAKSESILNR